MIAAQSSIQITHTMEPRMDTNTDKEMEEAAKKYADERVDFGDFRHPGWAAHVLAEGFLAGARWQRDRKPVNGELEGED